MTTDTKRSERSARAALASIIEMVKALKDAEGDEDVWEKAKQAIQEDALSIEVRSGWVSAGSALEPEEYMILLITGGPAVRVIGELNMEQPETARLEHQDWFTPWTELPLEEEETEALLAYASQFYFGS